MINPVFLDSSFWIAYREEREIRHEQAKHVMMRLLQEKPRFVTIWPVFCEIHANFSRDAKKRELVLQDFWQNHLITVEQVSPHDQKDAIGLLRANRDKTYPLCDALSFAIMRRLGIRRVASFDRHFKQFGEFEIIC
jgi:predicted nucleic acid-binding protein